MTLKKYFTNKNLIILLVLLGLFLIIRLPGINLPYHQDEYKLANIVRDNSLVLGGLAGHPPLTEGLFRLADFLVGADHLRLWTLFFGFLSAVLLFLVVRHRLGKEAGLLAVALYSVCFYSVWASLMVDTDGAILPTFFLLSVFIYDQFLKSEKKIWWLVLLLASFIFGFLIKLSFILVVGAIVLDFLWVKRTEITFNKILSVFLVGVGMVLTFLGAIFMASKFFPEFDLRAIANHVWYFVNFSQRHYLQVIVQSIKVVMYLSPLFIIPLLFVSKKTFSFLRLFVIYLGCGFIFYFILFDFSIGALDKYLMFMIVPLSAILAQIITDTFKEKFLTRKIIYGSLLGGLILAVILVLVNFLPQTISPLYPKTAWFAQIASGHLNVLTPFTGGSGPLGFYISFLFIFLSFSISFLLAILGLLKSSLKQTSLIIIIVLGLGYNLVFMEELFWGRINGSTPKVLAESLTYIKNNPEINKVMTAGDIGAYELIALNKYSGRFYPVPTYEADHKEKFFQYHGHFLVVDMPHINENSFYYQYFSTCQTVFEDHSKNIKANIYQCSNQAKSSIFKL